MTDEELIARLRDNNFDHAAIREAALRKVADKVYAKLSAKGLYAEAQSARDTILALIPKGADHE